MMTTWKLSTFLKNLGMTILLLLVMVAWFALSAVVFIRVAEIAGFLFFFSPLIFMVILLMGED
jgi:hypothetical protein